MKALSHTGVFDMYISFLISSRRRRRTRSAALLSTRIQGSSTLMVKRLVAGHAFYDVDFLRLPETRLVEGGSEAYCVRSCAIQSNVLPRGDQAICGFRLDVVQEIRLVVSLRHRHRCIS